MSVSQAEAVYTVADLDRRIKRAVEGVTADVWVVGEVSNAKPSPSGHVYFSLKDEREDAVLDCVMYRSAPVRARRLVTDGARIQLRGRATLWAPRGKLQFIGELARPVGRGALLEALEQLKNKLLLEGLFDPARKRSVPRDVRTLGVVTSATGAVIHDIAKVAFRRGAVRILLSPSIVQGQEAASRIIAALDCLEAVRGVDVIVLGRGGGSSDDLMVFNDEMVVRRVAACRIPLVSAVGHEVDVTLVDMVADARAATPSHAAELVVADDASRMAQLRQLYARLLRAMSNRLGEDASTLAHMRHGMDSFRRTISECQQGLDERMHRMEQAGFRIAARRRAEAARLSLRLSARHPRAVVSTSRAALGPLEVRLRSTIEARISRLRGSLGQRAARLSALSPLSVLGRGYAIATKADGRAVRAVHEVSRGERLTLRLHQGTLSVQVEERSETMDLGRPENHRPKDMS